MCVCVRVRVCVHGLPSYQMCVCECADVCARLCVCVCALVCVFDLPICLARAGLFWVVAPLAGEEHDQSERSSDLLTCVCVCVCVRSCE